MEADGPPNASLPHPPHKKPLLPKHRRPDLVIPTPDSTVELGMARSMGAGWSLETLREAAGVLGRRPEMPEMGHGRAMIRRFGGWVVGVLYASGGRSWPLPPNPPGPVRIAQGGSDPGLRS